MPYSRGENLITVELCAASIIVAHIELLSEGLTGKDADLALNLAEIGRGDKYCEGNLP
jgi:hypothetical protein